MEQPQPQAIEQQIAEAVKNYLPRCCGQCRHETEMSYCRKNPNLSTAGSHMLRRHPKCPLEDKKGATK